MRDPSATLHLLGASLPRSGHHFLLGLLQDCLGDRFASCHGQAYAGCCGAEVCARPQDVSWHFRRDHDYELRLSQDHTDALYVVQHRAPMARALSCAEMFRAREGAEALAKREDMVWWLVELAQYTAGFWRKWIANPPANAVVIDYEDLVDDTAATLARLLDRLGISLPSEQLDAAIDGRRPVRVASPEEPKYGQAFSPRQVGRDGAIPPDLLAAYDDLVRHTCPGAAWRQEPRSASPAPDLVSLHERLRALHGLDAEDAAALLDGPGASRHWRFVEAVAKRLNQLEDFPRAYHALMTIGDDGPTPPRTQLALSRLAAKAGWTGDARRHLDRVREGDADGALADAAREIEVRVQDIEARRARKARTAAALAWMESLY